MSRREGKCYVWTKADAVSVRRHTQLSCRKDNRLLGQHYTKLSDSGDPQRQEEAAEVGAQKQVILLPSPSLSFTLSTLGAKLEESRMPTASNTREWWQAVCLFTTMIHLRCGVFLQCTHHPENKLHWRRQKGTLSIHIYWAAWSERIFVSFTPW